MKDYRKYFSELERIEIAQEAQMHPKSVALVLNGKWKNEKVLIGAKKVLERKINHLQEVIKELEQY